MTNYYSEQKICYEKITVANWQKNAARYNLVRPEVCQFLKLYNDRAGETLTLWSHYNRPRWERFVVRYDDIVSYRLIGIHLEFIMRSGSIMIGGWNMPQLQLLLEQRVVRSLREMPENELHTLNDPVYKENRRDVLTNCIFPISMLFSANGLVYDPPEKVRAGAVLH